MLGRREINRLSDAELSRWVRFSALQSTPGRPLLMATLAMETSLRASRAFAECLCSEAHRDSNAVARTIPGRDAVDALLCRIGEQRPRAVRHDAEVAEDPTVICGHSTRVVDHAAGAFEYVASAVATYMPCIRRNW